MFDSFLGTTNTEDRREKSLKKAVILKFQTMTKDKKTHVRKQQVTVLLEEGEEIIAWTFPTEGVYG